jgi:hypothetical protein
MARIRVIDSMPGTMMANKEKFENRVDLDA